MIERLFDLVKPDLRPGAARRTPEVPSTHGPKFGPEPTKQNGPIRRLHGHMKRDSVHLVAATLRTGLLVGLALILILVLLPAAMAQAAGPR